MTFRKPKYRKWRNAASKNAFPNIKLEKKTNWLDFFSKNAFSRQNSQCQKTIGDRLGSESIFYEVKMGKTEGDIL